MRWLVGARTAEMPRRFLEWLERTESNEVARIELAPLDVSAIEAYSSRLRCLISTRTRGPSRSHATPAAIHCLFSKRCPRYWRRMQRHSRGAARLPAPGSVGQLIERRLQKLSRDALRLARVAALAGQDFSVELAACVLSAHPLDLAESWRELEVAQIIRADREGSAFAHDLILRRDAALGAWGNRDGHASRNCRRIAISRSACGARSPALVRREELDGAGNAFVEAAKDARRSSQRAAEAEHWQRAAECFDRAESAEQAFNARFESIDAVLLIHGVERATEVVNGLLREAKSTQQRVNALTAQANTRLLAAEHSAGIAAAREAYELAEQLDSPWPRFEAARLLAVGLSQSERASEALPLIEPFRELIEREGPSSNA